MTTERHCDYCGRPFTSPYPHKKFCHDECRIAFNAIVTECSKAAWRAIRESVRAIIRARNSEWTE